MKLPSRALLLLLLAPCLGHAQAYDGLNNHLGNLFLLAPAQSRSITPENPTGGRGRGGMAKIGEGSASEAARDLGQGWKVNPYVNITAGQTFTLAEIEGPGAIQHIWMTSGRRNWRNQILRFYWDDETEPSIEVPYGDFFANAYQFAPINSLAVTANPGSAFNAFWVMPFRKKARITMENIGDANVRLYYQIDYTLTAVPADAAYLHAQFRRVNPLPEREVFTIVDGIRGQGHFVGLYLLWQSNSNGWWGEGEVKFFLDGDGEFPTICGTGLEDYFLGSYNFELPTPAGGHTYTDFTTAYSGFHIFRPDGERVSQTRFGMYRWHLPDPIRFRQDLKVTVQGLGWRPDRRYLPLRDDISAVAFWYQSEPHAPFPPLPQRDLLDIY